jgi:alpha,alpha-trehalose-phosphate synthase [UDP-forming]
VEQVALDLRIARKIVTDSANETLNATEMWTEAKLRSLVHARLGENALCVISNREPYMHIHDTTLGETKCIRPAGGVVTAIHPILSACGGTWIAHGSGNEDKKFVNSKNKLGVPPQEIRYILKRVWLTKEEEEGYYFGFANEGLWPLCHNTHARPIFREKDWQEYKKVNQKFAEAVLEELPAKNPFIFIQDYHFTLLAKYIKEKRPDATIALFWHIPWPNPEAFSICPYQEEILEGLLGCDLIGFHVQNHCNNFLDTANRLLESRVDTERYSVMRFGKETLIRPFPISIDSTDTTLQSSERIISQISKLKKEFDLENKIIAVGVDRIDYTKGIVERMLAVERFLEKYPEYKGKFCLLQVGSPSRTHIKRYHELVSEIDELVERINWKYKDDDWKPIIYLKRHFSTEEIEPLYAMADMCLVSSLHDGMNLVAKEYVFAKKDLNGCLLLSQFTGAAKELTDAVLINPYSIEEFAEHIRFAIEMPPEEKKRRMRNMRTTIERNNVFRWAGKIITELTNIRKQ